MILNGIEVSISCDGAPKRECATHLEPNGREISAFVASRVGQEFEITVFDSNPKHGAHNALWIRVIADGRELAEVGTLRWQKLHIDHAKDEHGDTRRLVFTEPQYVDRDVEADEVLCKISLLEVVVYKAHSIGTSYGYGGKVNYSTNRSHFSPLCKLSDKCGRQGCHVVGLGSPLPKDQTRQHFDMNPYIKPLRGEFDVSSCAARFQFRLRSIDKLQVEGFEPSLTPQSTVDAVAKAVKLEMLDEHVFPASNCNDTSTTRQAAVRTQSTASACDAALVSSRISQLIAEARSLKNYFKYPREPIFLDSGELDPEAPGNESLLEYRALLRAYTVTVTQISGDDSGLSQFQYWHAVIRELERFVDICERWIRTASCLFLGKVRGKTPSIKVNRKASTARVVIELDSESSSAKRVADVRATGEKRKRDPIEVNDRKSQPFEEREYVDVKPIIKPDPDALVPVDKSSSSKTRLLQAKKAVQEAELAVQQKKLELSLTDLAILEEEETREAKRRRIGMAHAIDLTLD